MGDGFGSMLAYAEPCCQAMPVCFLLCQATACPYPLTSLPARALARRVRSISAAAAEPRAALTSPSTTMNSSFTMSPSDKMETCVVNGPRGCLGQLSRAWWEDHVSRCTHFNCDGDHGSMMAAQRKGTHIWHEELHAHTGKHLRGMKGTGNSAPCLQDRMQGRLGMQITL